jgi:DNA-binding NarL/FixJ family response regulator
MHGVMSLNRLLLCEKNKYFKDALLQIIQSCFPEIDIKWVLSSEECLAESKDFKPDILILGVNIYTGTNELDILPRLRENHPTVNIILFTDYGIEEYRKEAILRGANHIVSKESWTGNEILALLRTILASYKKSEDGPPESPAIDKDLLKRPLELRRKDLRGRAIEREYLAHNPDRRKKNTI